MNTEKEIQGTNAGEQGGGPGAGGGGGELGGGGWGLGEWLFMCPDFPTRVSSHPGTAEPQGLENRQPPSSTARRSDLIAVMEVRIDQAKPVGADWFSSL